MHAIAIDGKFVGFSNEKAAHSMGKMKSCDGK